MDKGDFGELLSCDPPITVPAWTVMSTGKSPGELGIYGFTNKKAGAYETFLPDSRAVLAPRVWDYLGAGGLYSIIIGMPQTAPAGPINGFLIGGQLAGSKAVPLSTWPKGLAKELNKLAGGQYLPDTFAHRRGAHEVLFKEARQNTASVFTLAAKLSATHFWHLLWLVIMAPDRIQHAALPATYTKETLAKSPVGAYYRYLDKKLTEFMAKLPESAQILILSDHGTRPCLGSFSLNRYLCQEGLLKLKYWPEKPQPLTPDLVDWPESKVYGQGGYYGRLYLNIRGREEAGAIEPDAGSKLLLELIDKLKNIKTPWPGLKNRLLLPAEIYPKCQGASPDLMLYAADLGARVSALIGGQDILWNDAEIAAGELDAANHSPYGLYISSLKLAEKPASIYDITPFIMDFFS